MVHARPLSLDAGTEKVKRPLYGSFGKSLISKEELLTTWRKIVNKTRLPVEEGVRVLGIDLTDALAGASLPGHSPAGLVLRADLTGAW